MLNQIVVLFALAMLLPFFQNCQPVMKFGAQDSNNTNSVASGRMNGGNGDGYGGKTGRVTFFVKANDVEVSVKELLRNENLTQIQISPNLPQGLNLNSSSGVISGTPVAVTSAYLPFEVSAKDQDGESVNASIELGVGYIYTVNPNIDGLGQPDANLDDHVCADANGRCSLQAALDQAAANPVKTRIILGEKTYLLGAKGISSPASFELVGQGIGKTVLNGEDKQQVMYLWGPDVSIKSLTVTHGKSGESNFGAGIRFNRYGGNTLGQLEIDQVEISYNAAGGTKQCGGGGMFAEFSKLTITRSKVHHNDGNVTGTCKAGGGGLNLTLGKALIQDTTINDNSSGSGAGIAYVGGELVFERSSLANNHAKGNGAGINFEMGGLATISASSFVGNVSEAGAGGGIFWLPAMDDRIDLTIDEVTFSKNSASEGAALYSGLSQCLPWYSDLYINDSTFAENIATAAGGGAIQTYNRCRINFANSIFTNNSSQNCTYSKTPDDGYAEVISQGSNRDSGNTCLVSPAPSDLVNTN